MLFIGMQFCLLLVAAQHCFHSLHCTELSAVYPNYNLAAFRTQLKDRYSKLLTLFLKANTFSRTSVLHWLKANGILAFKPYLAERFT